MRQCSEWTFTTSSGPASAAYVCFLHLSSLPPPSLTSGSPEHHCSGAGWFLHSHSAGGGAQLHLRASLPLQNQKVREMGKMCVCAFVHVWSLRVVYSHVKDLCCWFLLFGCRSKKRKVPLSCGEEVEMDLSQIEYVIVWHRAL